MGMCVDKQMRSCVFVVCVCACVCVCVRACMRAYKCEIVRACVVCVSNFLRNYSNVLQIFIH